MIKIYSAARDSPPSSDIIDNTCTSRARKLRIDASARYDAIRYRIGNRARRTKPDISPREFAPDVTSRCIEMKISEGKARPADLIGSTQITTGIYGARFSRATGRRALFAFSPSTIAIAIRRTNWTDPPPPRGTSSNN